MKPHECPICKKSFVKVHKLNVHMRIHNDEKPYLCPECGKSLSTNENLKRHLIRHSGIKVRNYNFGLLILKLLFTAIQLQSVPISICL